MPDAKASVPRQSLDRHVLTAVDHLLIGVENVAEASEDFRKLGFTVTHRRGDDGQDRQSAHVMFGDFHIEFRIRQQSPLRGQPGADKSSRALIFRTDDIGSEFARLKSRGFPLTGHSDQATIESDGSMTMRPAAVISNTPMGLVERDHALAGGIGVSVEAKAHLNTATVLERVYLAVESIDRELERFESFLGMSAPEPEMGTVIMSMMSVFYVGGVGIAVAEPRGPGPTADALEANGPGLFQVLFRARHLDAAAAVMVGNGLPSPLRGTRLSGESALLVDPAHACDLFVALAGEP